MTQITGFCALHYGVPFLASSIRSVIDTVDKYVVVYSPIGSHGHYSSLPCPDSRDELFAIAQEAAGDKLIWFDGYFRHEGEQREKVLGLVPDADIIIVADSDEVYPADQLETLLNEAMQGEVRHYLAYEFPFWRSFHRAIPARLCSPVRAINTRHTGGHQATDAYFAHFGYAQPTRYIEYKMTLHGHKADWRADWFTDKWQTNAQVDLHPTNHDFWFAEAVNPLDYLPAWMAEHPFFNLEVIP